MEDEKKTKNDEEKLFNYSVKGSHKEDETLLSISDDIINGVKNILSMFKKDTTNKNE